MISVFRSFLMGLLCFLALGNTQGQEAPLPPPAPPGGVSPSSYRQELPLVREANPKFYRVLATAAAGKLDRTVEPSALQAGDAAQSCRLVVLFPKNAPWAAPLQRGEMRLDDPKTNALLAQHGLRIVKWYDADARQDGLVLKSTGATTDWLAAAKELSLQKGVSVVFVKAPK
jgi:hypothetical protein